VVEWPVARWIYSRIGSRSRVGRRACAVSRKRLPDGRVFEFVGQISDAQELAGSLGLAIVAENVGVFGGATASKNWNWRVKPMQLSPFVFSIQKDAGWSGLVMVTPFSTATRILWKRRADGR
jgi:hypothetical protein